MTRNIRVWVDQKKCIGAGFCMDTAPAVFVLDATGKAVVIDPEGDTIEKIWEAAEGCPVSAIVIEDAETDEQLYP